ncbi:MAG TPA: UDP-2,3-diacylglucosamine diphosphatase [Longimicrobiaceae bacterium]|nr:UDP-2,3-diacylglucosamine diphosphatase [Longimicrobiaceae bacterium]
MDPRPAYVVSDIHLGAVAPETERAFRGFLAHVAGHASELLINGDLFDFWFEYRHVILAEHFRVVAALADVVEAGVKVSFVGGNHDAWAGDFLRQRIGVEVLHGPVEMTLGGRRALVAHGDGLGKGDFRYRALRALIRHPVTVGAFRWVHPDLGHRIAARASRTGHRTEGENEISRSRAAFIAAWAEERLRADPSLELVVAGHAHTPALVEVGPGRYYANTGDWIGRHHTYLVLPPGGAPPEIREWPPAG